MTDFQTATLAVQATANTQAFWIGAGQIAVAGIGVIVSAVLILRGLRTMERFGERREAAHERRHAETMTALRTLIERTTPKNGGSHTGT